jgi:hypothetical protein
MPGLAIMGAVMHTEVVLCRTASPALRLLPCPIGGYLLFSLRTGCLFDGIITWLLR